MLHRRLRRETIRLLARLAERLLALSALSPRPMATELRRHAASADRNKQPLGECLARHPPFSDAAGSALVLEVGSGTGQHVQHYATTFKHCMFQPTEFGGGSAGPEAPAYDDLEPVFASIAAWCEGLSNVRPAIELDASAPAWPAAIEASKFDALIVCNVLHISPFAVSEGLFAGASRLLSSGGGLFIYGPFTVDGGTHTAPSNEAFDARLKAQNGEWGLRDATALAALGASHGLSLVERAALPANNFCLVFKRD